MARLKAVAKKQAKKKPSIDLPPLVTQAWLATQFDQIDIALAVIVNRLEEVKKQNTLILSEVRKLKPSDSITPELEAAINQNAALTRAVDRKVPDQKKE